MNNMNRQQVTRFEIESTEKAIAELEKLSKVADPSGKVRLTGLIRIKKEYLAELKIDELLGM